MQFIFLCNLFLNFQLKYSCPAMPLDNLDYSIVEDYNGILLESAQLDLEFSNQLLPSPTRSDIIAKHLAAIRTQFPQMKDIKHARKWTAGSLVISNCKKSIDECIELITASEYGPVEVNAVLQSSDSYRLLFERPYNPVLLANSIRILCDCSCSVDALSSVGINGNVDINVYGENEAMYTFSIVIEKSPTVCCTYTHFWKYSVMGQVMNFIVHLENEWEKKCK